MLSWARWRTHRMTIYAIRVQRSRTPRHHTLCNHIGSVRYIPVPTRHRVRRRVRGVDRDAMMPGRLAQGHRQIESHRTRRQDPKVPGSFRFPLSRVASWVIGHGAVGRDDAKRFRRVRFDSPGQVATLANAGSATTATSTPRYPTPTPGGRRMRWRRNSQARRDAGDPRQSERRMRRRPRTRREPRAATGGGTGPVSLPA